MKLKAPFPAFGGKSRVAGMIWDRLGDVDNFVEPFANSAAVLLARPHPPRIETVNDLDCYVANFWRATQHDPDAVAAHADGPVNEADLHARHRRLVLSDEAAAFRNAMRTDPDYFDAKVAGWWCWGLCCWIGSGWCDTSRQDVETAKWEQRPTLWEGNGKGNGVHAGGKKLDDRSLILGGGEGQYGHVVHAKGNGSAEWSQRPQLEDAGGRGVLGDASRPQLADAYSRGRGVHNDNHLSEAVPLLRANQSGYTGSGVNQERDFGTCAQRRAWLLDWFGRLRDRLRTVRVCCGDWLRVCDSESVTTRLGVTGLFIDAPYRAKLKCGKRSRTAKIYSTDDATGAVVDRVIAYCLERGNQPMMRIAACCYEGEGYEVLLKNGWECVAWESRGGYGNRSDEGKANARRERIFFSPHCVDLGAPLFEGL